MSRVFSILAGTISPPAEPTCCPDAYLCLNGGLEMECPRHGGFDICCGNPALHVEQSPDVWHRQMERWERTLLDVHIGDYLRDRLQKSAYSKVADVVSVLNSATS